MYQSNRHTLAALKNVALFLLEKKVRSVNAVILPVRIHWGLGVSKNVLLKFALGMHIGCFSSSLSIRDQFYVTCDLWSILSAFAQLPFTYKCTLLPL